MCSHTNTKVAAAFASDDYTLCKRVVLTVAIQSSDNSSNEVVIIVVIIKVMR